MIEWIKQSDLEGSDLDFDGQVVVDDQEASPAR